MARSYRRSLTLVSLMIAMTWPLFATTTQPSLDEADQLIADLYTKNKLFDKKEYKTIRAAFAKRFELKYVSDIKSGYGDDYDAFTKWLDDNVDIKETFYTAIDQEFDKVENALKLFKDIWKKWPEKTFKQYYNLAIATAVVWDQPRNVYDYTYHQERTRSLLPAAMKAIGPMDNFQYYVEADQAIRKRAELLPWEFLVHVVNNRTPIDERKWSQKEYASKQKMIGKCYKDIKYDEEMLRTKGKECKLEGHDYTLQGIREYGGVCAMQADFAARVAKNLGIPAEYVGGAGNNLGLHAWVMWVEVQDPLVKDSVKFKLDSEGRYSDMQFYTGELHDPQTGQKILDRDMELRLSIVGFERAAKRHAELIMRGYPIICSQQNLDAKGKRDYLDKCLSICVHNEAAWLALAKMSKDGDLRKETIMSRGDKLLKTFTNFPDFTWKVLEDLLAVNKDKGDRSKLFGRLVEIYENARRPDLACEARIQLADYQLESKEPKKAAEGIANTIVKFPTEGRYVPKMMVKLQEACAHYKGGTDLLAEFYPKVLREIPVRRAGEVSEYAKNMYDQAIKFFHENRKDAKAEELKAQFQERLRGREVAQ
jgi:hypothetical protein